MPPKPSDLISIANPKLSEKLEKQAHKEEVKAEREAEAQTENTELGISYQNFKKDIWKAVFTLNLMRYGLALFLLVLLSLRQAEINLGMFDDLTHPTWFAVSTIILLLSAITFSFLTMTKKAALSQILVGQFAVDLLLATSMMHSTGSIASGFTLLYFVIVTTGSVVLRRKYALALASGAIILLFYEHLYSVFSSHIDIEANFTTLAGYGLLLMGVAIFISSLAQRLRHAELKKFIPGHESIEDYLVREEVSALKSALNKTDGNKTEAAKLLGMTFRSFRYKLTKYDIA